MKAELIKIGNSQGIRIPKPVIKQCRFSKTVELTVRNNCLVVSPHKNIRAGWDAAFRKAGRAEDQQLKEFEALTNTFDENEWSW